MLVTPCLDRSFDVSYQDALFNFTQNPNLKEIWMGIKMMPIFANKKGGCHHTGLDV
jgi:hypothetical protein